tara:strand:+ start:134 stop:838 length:705 start_codon:yes stop_codon:yes gene_type:complete
MFFFKKDRDVFSESYSEILNHIISHDRWKIILKIIKKRDLLFEFKAVNMDVDEYNIYAKGNNEWIEGSIKNIGVTMQLSDRMEDTIKYVDFAGDVFRYKSNIDLLLKTSFEVKDIKGDFAFNQVKEIFIGKIHIENPIEYLMPTGFMRFHGDLLPFEKDPGAISTYQVIDSQNQDNFLLLLDELSQLGEKTSDDKNKPSPKFEESEIEKIKGYLKEGEIDKKLYDSRKNQILGI